MLSSVFSSSSVICVSMSTVAISHGSSLTMTPLGDGGRFLNAIDTEFEDSEESGVSQDLWEYEEVVERITAKKKKVVN